MPNTVPRPAARRRAGFSIVEVIVAIVLLGVALSSLGVLAFQASRRARTVSAGAHRAAAMGILVDRYAALDFDDVTSASQSLDSTIATGPMPHRRRAIFDPAVSPTERRITLIVTPANALVRPETTVLRRYRWSTSNPLNLSTP